jgi:hypothetical protein
MRFSIARRFALAALIPALFSLSIIPGCSKQSEGDRCGTGTAVKDSAPDDTDCDDGLTCQLVDPTTGTYRCCNPTRLTNPRCAPVTVVASSGGAGGASNGGASNGGASNGGANAGASGETATVGESGAEGT